MPEGRKELMEDARPAALGTDQDMRRLVLRGWLIVCAMAILFVLYGFLAFSIIGDKGPPDWDFGSLPDVPAQSEYSTYPYGGGPKEPEPQQINQKPPQAEAGIPSRDIPPIPEMGPSKGEGQ